MSERRCALYARYSDHEQDGSSAIESQIRECRTYARTHGLVIVEEAVYIDRARTGTTTEQRDAFRTMIAAAPRTPRPFDVLLVWKFSRFARNREDSALNKALLRRRGVQVNSVSEPVDHHSASGILTEAKIEAIDASYSARLAEEVRRGQTQTALDGYSTGAKSPYGYGRREVPDWGGRAARTLGCTRAGWPVWPGDRRRIQRTGSAAVGRPYLRGQDQDLPPPAHAWHPVRFRTVRPDRQACSGAWGKPGTRTGWSARPCVQGRLSVGTPRRSWEPP